MTQIEVKYLVRHKVCDGTGIVVPSIDGWTAVPCRACAGTGYVEA